MKKIALALMTLLVLFLGYVALKPAEYFIIREITIQAPADKIFPYLNNSKLAGLWGPWMKIDPKTVMVLSGPEAGVGSKTSWDGGEKLGTGSATIVESIANQQVAIKLEYTKPFQMEQDSLYTIKSAGAASIVSWSVRGKNNFIGRLMCSFGNMDKMVGGMFETGLANLKALVENTK